MWFMKQFVYFVTDTDTNKQIDGPTSNLAHTTTTATTTTTTTTGTTTAAAPWNIQQVYSILTQTPSHIFSRSTTA